MVNMFFRLTFSNVQWLSQAFKLEQAERMVQVQVLEDDPAAINLSAGGPDAWCFSLYSQVVQ